MADFDPELRSRFVLHLERFERRAHPCEDACKRAAVAVVVLPDEKGQACVLLTLRAAGLRRHSGQWAFPGGRCDPGGGRSPRDRIAILERFVPINFSGGVNCVDCATGWAWHRRVRREQIYLRGERACSARIVRQSLTYRKPLARLLGA